MLHLSWDAKVDSLQLSAYNDAQIMDIWFSEDKVEDPGDSKKDKLEKEGGYSSLIWTRPQKIYTELLTIPAPMMVLGFFCLSWPIISHFSCSKKFYRMI